MEYAASRCCPVCAASIQGSGCQCAMAVHARGIALSQTRERPLARWGVRAMARKLLYPGIAKKGCTTILQQAFSKRTACREFAAQGNTAHPVHSMDDFCRAIFSFESFDKSPDCGAQDAIILRMMAAQSPAGATARHARRLRTTPVDRHRAQDAQDRRSTLCRPPCNFN